MTRKPKTPAPEKNPPPNSGPRAALVVAGELGGYCLLARDGSAVLYASSRIEPVLAAVATILTDRDVLALDIHFEGEEEESDGADPA